MQHFERSKEMCQLKDESISWQNAEKELFREINQLIYVNDYPMAHNPRLDFKDMNMENKFIFLKRE